MSDYPEWQPISSAPKDGTEILGYDGVTMENIKWRLGLWVTSWGHDEQYSLDGEPTHWMPLPPPPKEK